jgi:hypothetical protein
VEAGASPILEFLSKITLPVFASITYNEEIALLNCESLSKFLNAVASFVVIVCE